ncbi:MAG: tRNA-dihydrouridine synthase [Phycisphaerae bacterium]|nr:tRNA-dihydrouridine synthase [Phycisphaerae bacterium]
MSCQSNNATPPGPPVAPGLERVDAAEAARWVAARFGRDGSVPPRLRELLPSFDAPFFQAGLAGYSDAAMRLIARRHGCPYCVTEALLDRTLLAGGRGFAKADLGEIEDNVPGGADDRPLAGQVMGSDPREMAAAAIKMVEQGARRDGAYRSLAYERPGCFPSGPGAPDRPGSPLPEPAASPPTASSFDVIDVNLACPVKKIDRKARGGHWLAQPAGAIAILEAVRAAVPSAIACSVKLRRSYDDTPEMADAFERIFDAAYALGYAWTTVHARTVEQKYVGPSRWTFLRDLVASRPDRIIFGSGDVWEAADIFRMLRYTGVSAVSVARGCIGNPWIFRQARDLLAGRPARPPTLEQQRDVLREHFDLALRVNAAHGVRRVEAFTGRTMRKFAIRFAAFHPRADEVRARFIAVETAEEWDAVVAEFYPAADARTSRARVSGCAAPLVPSAG